MVCVTRGLVIADRLFNEQTERDAINCFFRCLCTVFPRIQFLCASSMPFFVQSPKNFNLKRRINKPGMKSWWCVLQHINPPLFPPPPLPHFTPSLKYISIFCCSSNQKTSIISPFRLRKKKTFKNTSCSKAAGSPVYKPCSSRISPSTSS